MKLELDLKRDYPIIEVFYMYENNKIVFLVEYMDKRSNFNEEVDFYYCNDYCADVLDFKVCENSIICLGASTYNKIPSKAVIKILNSLLKEYKLRAFK